MDTLLNRHWWADALRQRRELDSLAHAEGREQQMVDPDGRAPHAEDHELTDWEKAWIRARIEDAHVLHLTARNEARAVLAESEEEHHARELNARAMSYFDGTHDETRAKFRALREKHARNRDEIHARRRALAKDQTVEHGHLGELLEQHETMIAQVDSHLELVDRHIATVQAEVNEKRRHAREQVEKAERLIARPFDEHIAIELARVQDELRSRK